MDIKHIGNNIYKLRLTRGLTQETLGRQIGLTASAISNIENATSYPSIDTLIKIAEFFGVTLDYLSTDKYYEQLEELEIKAKLLTTEQYICSNRCRNYIYEIGNKTYLLEEDESGISYRVKVDRKNKEEA